MSPVRLVPRGRSPIAIGGLHSYAGTVELSAASDGLVVSDRLPLERYLLGLNEVPLDWPMEALRAQAVAARTYALFTLGQGRTGEAAVYGYDICATVQCQVFSGADVIRAKDGKRWIEAVESTAGQTVFYDGAPILARYHSTSGGATLDNEDAFPDEAAYPYLKSVPSTTEQGSPLYRWSVTFRLDRLTETLRRAGLWSRGRITSVATAPADAGHFDPRVLVRGVEGRGRKAAPLRMIVAASEFRDAVRDTAPSLYPDLYPSAAPTSTGRLPETLPSHRVTIHMRRKTVVVIGRGWGHGSGMSQWGAHGMAAEGASYLDILAHYYTGTSVGTVERAEPIEVGVASGLATATATGSFSIVDGRGKTLVPRALGTWTFRSAGAGAVAIAPPRGFGLPLEVGIVDAPKRVVVGEPAFLTVALSRPAKIRTRTTDSPTGYRDPGVEIKEAGRRRVVWLAPLEEGSYRVRVDARAGPTQKSSEPVEIVVRQAASRHDVPGAVGDDERDAPAGAPRWVFVVLAIVAMGVGVSLMRGSSRSSRP